MHKRKRDSTDERIEKKEEVLQDIYSRIYLMEETRYLVLLDEQIKKANELEFFLKKTATGRAHYEKETGVYKNSEIYLTTEDVEEAFKDRELDEDGKKLFSFAMLTVANRFSTNRICDVELAIYLSHNSKVIITKGAPKEKMIIILDERNKPVLNSWKIHNNMPERTRASTDRIEKKEKELKAIYSRIYSMEEERKLDEDIKKANDLESFLNKTATGRADYEKESGIDLKAEDVEEAFYERELDEDGKKLFRFAMRTVAQKNRSSRLCDVELAIYLAHNSKVTITKGYPKETMVIILDEENEPVLGREINFESSLPKPHTAFDTKSFDDSD